MLSEPVEGRDLVLCIVISPYNLINLTNNPRKRDPFPRLPSWKNLAYPQYLYQTISYA
jgi:hypothetical protein